jgi:hypothetical protein
MQLEIRSVAARLTVLRHQRLQLGAKLRHIVAVIILLECNAMTRPPNLPAVPAFAVRSDGRAAKRMTEQARCDCVTGFVNSDPLIVFLAAADRGKEFIIPTAILIVRASALRSIT